MKITDYALVFVGVTLPFILIAYINIALTIRTFQQEMYYQKVIDTAVEDAMNEMKRVESDEVTNTYGYSGEEDNRLSINPEIAKEAFFKSFYGSLNILDDEATQSIAQIYVPVLAILDYNGVYISSIEEIDGEYKHVLKPKKYFTLLFGRYKDGFYYVRLNDGWYKCEYKNKWAMATSKSDNIKISSFDYLNSLEYTTDDRVFSTYITVSLTGGGYNLKYGSSKNFYISDSSNNQSLFGYTDSSSDANIAFANFLAGLKRQVMLDVITRELAYATNKNNEYARAKGISYNFAFANESTDEMYDYIDNIGVLALVQGIKVGHKYLNYKAYNVSDLQITHKYYVTNYSAKFGSEKNSRLKLYHKTSTCAEYIEDCKYDRTMGIDLSQSFFYSRETAASKGYYPCPICNP